MHSTTQVLKNTPILPDHPVSSKELGRDNEIRIQKNHDKDQGPCTHTASIQAKSGNRH